MFGSNKRREREGVEALRFALSIVELQLAAVNLAAVVNAGRRHNTCWKCSREMEVTEFRIGDACVCPYCGVTGVVG